MLVMQCFGERADRERERKEPWPGSFHVLLIVTVQAHAGSKLYPEKGVK